MVPIRCVSLLLLAPLLLNDSMAEDHEGAVTRVDDAVSAVAQELSIGDTTIVNTGNKWFNGRKLAKKDHGVKEGTIDAGPSKTLNTIHAVDECVPERKMKPGVARKLINTDVFTKKANAKGLVAFNSDYYVPRPHPPKNN